MPVRVRAAALNRGEFIASLGLHAAGAAAKPAGQECAGEVIEMESNAQVGKIVVSAG